MANSDLASVSLGGSVPLYARVYRVIADQIERGELRPRDRLPPERAICEKLEVSRVTVRRALQQLAEDGIIEPAAGRGYCVASAVVSEPPTVLQSFTTMGHERGLVVSARILSNAVRPATLDEAEVLRLAPGDGLFELIRVRLLNGLPIALNRSRIAHSRAPGIEDVDFSNASLYQTLEERWDIAPSRADYVIEAIAATEHEAGLLDLETGAPLLVARETMYDQTGTPTDWAEIAYRGDRYRFQTTLVRPPRRPGA